MAFGWLLGVLALVGAGRARAEETPRAVQAPSRGKEPTSVELVRIDFAAPETCPTELRFHDALRARTEKFRLVESEVATQRFEVVIRDEGQEFAGTLRVHTSSRASEQRELRAQSCEEVLETFALMIAVAIDPDAQLTPKPEPEPVRPPASEGEPPVPPPAPAPREVLARPGVKKKSTWGWTAGLLAEARGGIAPQAAAAGGILLDVERDGGKRFSWVARLSVLRSLPARVTDDLARQVAFTWTSARAEVGVGAKDPSTALAVRVTAGVEAGAVAAEAESSVERGRGESRPWLAPLSSAHVVWSGFEPLSFELYAGAFFVAVRDEFRFLAPSRLVYQTPAIAGFAGFGLAVRFD